MIVDIAMFALVMYIAYIAEGFCKSEPFEEPFVDTSYIENKHQPGAYICVNNVEYRL